MIEVFPAPVAPTIATLSPAAIVKSTSRSTQSPSLYAKLTLSKRTSPRTCASSRGCGGGAMGAGGWGSRETRPRDATGALNVLLFFHRTGGGGGECARGGPEGRSGPAGH